MFISNILRRLFALSLFLSPVCTWSENPEKLVILSSIRPISLLVSDLVAGLPVEVKTLLPANADPHNWAMRISDRQLLASADLVVWLSPDFESFLVKPIRELPVERQLELGALSGLQWPNTHPYGEEGSHGHHHDHHHGGRDMHLWLNPANAVEIQIALTEHLIKMRPDWRSTLKENLQKQVAQIKNIQTDIHRRLALYRQNGFIVYHDTYEHFVAAFGLRQLDSVNQFSEQRLSAKTLQRLQTHAQGAHCLLAEKNARQEQRLAKTLKLPLVLADALAFNSQLTTFAEFLDEITVAFEHCFNE